MLRAAIGRTDLVSASVKFLPAFSEKKAVMLGSVFSVVSAKGASAAACGLQSLLTRARLG